MMNVRVDDQSYKILNKLANIMGKPKTETLAYVIHKIWRQWLIDETCKGYDRLASDPEKWKEVQEEQKLWDNTASDGL
jgi:hypothetical protein